MVTQFTETELTEPSGGRPIGTVARALGGLVLALAVAGGIGGWNLTHQRAASTTVVQPADGAPVAVVDSAMRPPAIGPAVPASRVYLVGSPEDAEVLRADLAKAEAIRLEVGEPPRRSTVLVVNSAAAEAELAQLITADSYTHRATGERGLQLVDLRPAE